MKSEIFKFINSYDLPIYICGHIKPDQDSICSSIALSIILQKLGKKAYVLLEENDKEILNWTNTHNCIINDIVDDDYIFIAVDVNEKKRLGKYEKSFDNATHTINIDHHQDNKREADIVYSNTHMSSTCEMIYELLSNIDTNLLDKEIASYLYSGILNDTNCFSRRLSNKTFLIAQELINTGIDYSHIIQKTLKERTLYEFKALAKLVNQISYDDFHYVIINKQDPIFADLTHNQIVKKIAEDLRTIEGMDVFILLIKNGDTITAKCMSNISENADKIAALFGGGGHKKEAGFTITGKSESDILKEIKAYIKNNKTEKKR